MQITFERDDVTRCLTGAALDQLLTLSDCHKHRIEQAHGLSFVFAGWGEDGRLPCQIPECRRFFAAVTESWPFWFYFLRKGGADVRLALSLLAPVEVVSRDSGISVTFVDDIALHRTCNQLLNGMAMLHSHLQMGQDEYLDSLDKVQAEIARVT